MDLPQETALPDHDVRGSGGQPETSMTDNNDQEVSDSTSEGESDEILSPGSGSSSEEAAGHQKPRVILGTPIDEMYENLINEIEPDVNAIVKLPKRLLRLLISPRPAIPTTETAADSAAKTAAPTTMKTELPACLKPKKSRVEKPKAKKRAKRSERKVQAIQAWAEARLTDPDSDTDETESPTFENRDERAAVQRASRLMNPESMHTRPRFVFWTDGSAKDRPAQMPAFGSAVTYKRPFGNDQQWVGFAYKIFGAGKVLNTELFAIAMALRITSQEAQLYPDRTASLQEPGASEGEEVLPKVYILTDWAEGLTWIKRSIDGAPVKDEISAAILQIIQQALESLGRLGVLVRLCWVPGHVGLEGNTLADLLAGAARKCHCVDSPHPRNPSESFEAFLISPERNIPVVGGGSSDGLRESNDWEEFQKFLDGTLEERKSVTGEETFDYEGWERIRRMMDVMGLPRSSSEA
ncbi:reverse transcriptase [Apiospora marii]|uniref:Reverse transcriptase n=1 Tax=Apiospora marii TaxID=335849 RepID=A0ABR1RH85_9PEZI